MNIAYIENMHVQIKRIGSQIQKEGEVQMKNNKLVTLRTVHTNISLLINNQELEIALFVVPQNIILNNKKEQNNWGTFCVVKKEFKEAI